jgi:dTDP-4-amino-4,6-dideoxygalactose transaminase
MRGILDPFDCPIADTIHQTTLSLPLSYAHAADEVYRVIEVMNGF